MTEIEQALWAKYVAYVNKLRLKYGYANDFGLVAKGESSHMGRLFNAWLNEMGKTRTEQEVNNILFSLED